MARSLRLEYAGAVYHVTARGNRREAIFETVEDRNKFLDVLGRVVAGDQQDESDEDSGAVYVY